MLIAVEARDGLQYGVPFPVIVEKLTNTRYEPMGMTDDPEIPEASSVMDYVVRRLALDFMSFEDRRKIGIFTPDEQSQMPSGDASISPDVPAWLS
ncbi:hypothetical protein UK23_01840 [Lentzea aerocolonigenes]|uniref:Uncharacterized protein n=1 Tax=Lentzea aerocolonigenes TaxID=68170 RepID=A0A0F0HBQ1_LENAE|nr:hypothetical protein UK23_01840 [Lentzea aerocolonigenes]